MKSNTTLEDFVKNYVQSKASSETNEEYRKWLKNNGVNSELIYDASIKDITGDYAKAKSEHGSLAESLGRLGLTASGYSDYLSGKAYSEMQKRKAGARDAYLKNESENRKGYADYVAIKAKAESNTYADAVKEISDAGIINYDEAYKLAVGKGLPSDIAELAAKVGSDSVRKKTRENVLKVIISQGFSQKQAQQYALALGLSKEDAEELADYANKINRESHYSTDYLEYLKEKWAEESGKGN